jgi:hypothetical protein
MRACVRGVCLLLVGAGAEGRRLRPEQRGSPALCAADTRTRARHRALMISHIVQGACQAELLAHVLAWLFEWLFELDGVAAMPVCALCWRPAAHARRTDTAFTLLATMAAGGRWCR